MAESGFVIPHPASSIENRYATAPDLRKLSRLGEIAHSSEAALLPGRARRDVIRENPPDVRAMVQAAPARVRKNKERFFRGRSLRRESFVQARPHDHEGAPGKGGHP